MSRHNRHTGTLGWHQKYAPLSWTQPMEGEGTNGPVKITKFVNGEPASSVELPARPADAPSRTDNFFFRVKDPLYHSSSNAIRQALRGRRKP